MASGERGEALDREIEIGQQRIDRGAEFKHQRGVDDILAGGAPMHEIRRLLVARGDRLRQRIHHGDGDVAGGGRRFHERCDVVALSVAGLADDGRAGRRDHADRGLGAGQGGFEVEHALQPRAIAHDGAHRRAGVERRHQLGGHQRVGHPALLDPPGGPTPIPGDWRREGGMLKRPFQALPKGLSRALSLALSLA